MLHSFFVYRIIFENSFFEHPKQQRLDIFLKMGWNIRLSRKLKPCQTKVIQFTIFYHFFNPPLSKHYGKSQNS